MKDKQMMGLKKGLGLLKTGSVAMVLIAVVWALLAPAVFAADAKPEDHESGQVVRIGVLAKRGQDKCLQEWEPTARYLGSQIPGHTFKIVPLDFNEICSAAEREEVEFILANPSFYVGLERSYGANRIVTLQNLRQGNAYKIFGGVIFCMADRKEIQRPGDLVGKTFCAVTETSFGGWQVAWRELKQHGIDPQRDFSALRFAGTHDAVVWAVLGGEADAGTVRTDTLERMAKEGKINLDKFRVIDQRSDDAGFNFLRSTRLYPEWPLAKLFRTSDELAEQVAAALMNMPADCPAAKAANCADPTELPASACMPHGTPRWPVQGLRESDRARGVSAIPALVPDGDSCSHRCYSGNGLCAATQPETDPGCFDPKKARPSAG